MNETGYVAALFPGFGVGEYLPGLGSCTCTARGGWRGRDPFALAVPIGLLADGTALGSSPAGGVWEFDPVGWFQLTAANSSVFAVS